MLAANSKTNRCDPGLARSFALFLCLWLFPGCQTLGATTHNLGALHREDGSHRRRAGMVTPIQYLMERGLQGAIFRRQREDLKIDDSDVKDPEGTCVELLLKLSSLDATSALERSRQVEWFTRLALDDDWALSRERAVFALGSLGKELGILLPRSLAPDVDVAEMEVVRSAVARVVAAVRPIVEEGASKESDLLEEVDASVRALAGLTFDLDGARRILRFLGDRLEEPWPRQTRESFEAALLHVEREAVRLALAAALVDRSARVRAAAVRACVEALGRAPVDAFLQQIARERSPQVLLAVLDQVIDLGLPSSDEILGNVDPVRVRQSWLRALYRLAMNHPDGQVRVRAMQALSVSTGGELESLREEDWHAFFMELYPDGVPREAEGNAP